MQTGPKTRTTWPLKVGVIVLLAVIYLGVSTYFKSSRDGRLESNSGTGTGPAVQQQGSTAYRNGTYTATGNYVSPGGQEDITVTLTISNDTITSASATTHAAAPISRQYQGEFVSNFKPLVIGKNIADLKLGKVAGSSLTGKGFNDALEKIKLEAES